MAGIVLKVVYKLRGIARRLASQYQVFALDWLGFGQSERPPLDYQPTLYHQLLFDFVRSRRDPLRGARFDRPIILIAADHRAGYALRLANTHPDAVAKIILIAPTWRGPLRVMGAPTGIRKWVQNLVRSYSLAEMEALGKLSNVETVRLPGTLGIHEEYPEAVAEAILKFL